MTLQIHAFLVEVSSDLRTLAWDIVNRNQDLYGRTVSHEEDLMMRTRELVHEEIIKLSRSLHDKCLVTENSITEKPVPEEPPERCVSRFVDRIESLIKSENDLTVAEAVGALQMVSHQLIKTAVEKAEEEE